MRRTRMIGLFVVSACAVSAPLVTSAHGSSSAAATTSDPTLTLQVTPATQKVAYGGFGAARWSIANGGPSSWDTTTDRATVSFTSGADVTIESFGASSYWTCETASLRCTTNAFAVSPGTSSPPIDVGFLLSETAAAPTSVSATFTTTQGPPTDVLQPCSAHPCSSSDPVASYIEPVAPPTVAKLGPNKGSEAGGTSVTITGTNLTEASSVKFGATAASSFKVNSESSITATSPAGKGTVDVTVTTMGGTSATSSADQFGYAPPPSVTKVRPSKGPSAGGTTVTITGSNLGEASAVKFGSTSAASFKVISASSVTAVSPPHPKRTVDVTVTTPGGVSAIVRKDRFKYAR